MKSGKNRQASVWIALCFTVVISAALLAVPLQPPQAIDGTITNSGSIDLANRIAEAKLKSRGDSQEADKNIPPLPEFSILPEPSIAVEADYLNRQAKVQPATNESVSQKIEKPLPTPTVPVEPVQSASPEVSIDVTGDLWIDEILRLTNAAREAEGLKPLTLNAQLNQAAAIRVSELPASPSPHLRPDGNSYRTVFSEFGIIAERLGENYIVSSANSFSPEEIVNAWLNSPSHRRNILNSSFLEIGIGHGVIDNREYFEQLFIG